MTTTGPATTASPSTNVETTNVETTTIEPAATTTTAAAPTTTVSPTSAASTTAAAPTTTSTPATTVAPTTSVGLQTTTTPSPAVTASDDRCPDITFTGLPVGWRYEVHAEQGGGSGLPGLHIAGDRAYFNIGMGGSAFAPREGDQIRIDGYSALRGPIEDGDGINIVIDQEDCEFIALNFYGASAAEIDLIADGISIGNA